MPKPEKAYIGEVASHYKFEDESQRDRAVELDRGFWRDSDSGNFLIFRRQRNRDTVSNVRQGAKASPGFFGNRIGGANKESALALGSGHVDSLKFPYNVLYELSEDASKEVVDLRKPSEVPLSLFALYALSRSIGPVLGREKFDNHPLLEDRTIITGRPMMQSVFAPDVRPDRLRQPAAFMHVPYQMHEVALSALAHRNIKRKQ